MKNPGFCSNFICHSSNKALESYQEILEKWSHHQLFWIISKMSYWFLKCLWSFDWVPNCSQFPDLGEELLPTYFPMSLTCPFFQVFIKGSSLLDLSRQIDFFLHPPSPPWLSSCIIPCEQTPFVLFVLNKYCFLGVGLHQICCLTCTSFTFII